MVNFPTRIPDCDSHSPALLDLFISSDASICSAMAFPPLGNSEHVVVSVSIDFPSYSQRDASFHRIAYDYSRVSASATEFCEWIQVGKYHRKYQVKPHSSPWFSAACAAVIVYRNHFFCLY